MVRPTKLNEWRVRSSMSLSSSTQESIAAINYSLFATYILSKRGECFSDFYFFLLVSSCYKAARRQTSADNEDSRIAAGF